MSDPIEAPPPLSPETSTQMLRDPLLEEAALILEQEGWLLKRLVMDSFSNRLQRFCDRYVAWQEKVDAWRKANPDEWAEPPDNS